MPTKKTPAPIGARRGAALCQKPTPQPPARRVREPVTRSRGRVVGFYSSTKNMRHVAWESQLEQKACNVFEFSPAITSYREQPVTIHFQSNGELLRYTTDFELMLINGQRLYAEIKPAKYLEEPEGKQRLQDIATYWQRKNQGFIVITDEELNYPDMQNNLSLLRAYQRFRCSEELIRQGVFWVSDAPVNNLLGLMTYLGSPAAAYALIAQGHITANLHQPFSFDTALHLPEDFQHETYLFTYRTAPDFERCTLPD